MFLGSLPPRSDPARRWFLAAGMALIGSSALDPILPLYVLARGGNVADVALFFTLPAVTQLILQVPAGHLIDRFGSSRVFITSRFVGALVSLILFAVQGPLFALLLVRTFHGVSTAAFFPATRAALSRITPVELVGERFAQYQALVLASAMVGPLVGGLVAAANPEFVFALHAAASLGSAALVMTAPQITTPPATGAGVPPPPEPGPKVKRWTLSRGVLVSAAVLAGFYAYWGMFDVVWPQYITSRGYSPFILGLTVSAGYLPGVILSSRIGRVAGGRQRKAVAAAALAIASACAIAYPQLHLLLVILPVVLVQWSAFAFVGPVALASLSESVPPEARGRAMAVGGMGETLGAIAGFTLLGSLYGVDPGLPFIAAAVVLGLAAITAATLLPPRRSGGLVEVRFLEALEGVRRGHQVDVEKLRALANELRHKSGPEAEAYISALDEATMGAKSDAEVLSRLQQRIGAQPALAVGVDSIAGVDPAAVE